MKSFNEIKKELNNAIEIINELDISIQSEDLNATLLVMSMAESRFYKAIVYKDCFTKDKYEEIEKLEEKYGRVWNKKMDYSNLYKIIIKK